MVLPSWSSLPEIGICQARTLPNADFESDLLRVFGQEDHH